ncbi:prepilin-type N-terminal cleavage/methylation domain-containing protein [Photobacterium sp. TLY01]|uniref:type IV pilus modification PilV family protein n=1 Tax=Photobacterium sp. TLY01 TaxID=2907534 RepID=UPI001F442FD2|nr:prepilin-type N-terminal cleavage/methylation domain-containing protein [Photobacterium sp. TLY01]UIP27336.1 prepilin-type N-terminal cleavage/methylation domain-containing protein [Photobacterium sp. TLY01]
MSDSIKPVLKKQSGFSLMEVLVSLMLVSVGLAGLMKLHGYLNIQADNALIMLSAVNLAESQLETLRAAPQPGPYSHAEQHTFHRVTMSLETLAEHDTQPGGISTVTVQASWQDRWHHKHQVTLETRMPVALH